MKSSISVYQVIANKYQQYLLLDKSVYSSYVFVQMKRSTKMVSTEITSEDVKDNQDSKINTYYHGHNNRTNQSISLN